MQTRSLEFQKEHLSALKKVGSERDVILKKAEEKTLNWRDRLNNAIDNGFRTEESTKSQNTPTWIDPSNQTPVEIDDGLIKKPHPLHTQSVHQERTILKKVESRPNAILKIKNPTNNELELALELNPTLALKIEVLSEEIQGFLVENNPENIQYISKPTKKIERYVVYRGFLDFRNGNYYWKKANKKPQYLFTKMQVHPFIGMVPASVVIIGIRMLSRFSLPGIYIIYSIFKKVRNWFNKKERI